MSTRRERANAEAYRRLCAADPILIDILPALEALPGLDATTILTSGPPMAWELLRRRPAQRGNRRRTLRGSCPHRSRSRGQDRQWRDSGRALQPIRLRRIARRNLYCLDARFGRQERRTRQSGLLQFL